jgi:hypothetical protein
MEFLRHKGIAGGLSSAFPSFADCKPPPSLFWVLLKPQPAMGYTSIYKLAVAIAFSLLIATPIAASSTTPAVLPAVSVATPSYIPNPSPVASPIVPIYVQPRQADTATNVADTTTIVSGAPPIYNTRQRSFC